MNRTLALMILIGLLMTVLSLRLILVMESSLDEGRGPGLDRDEMAGIPLLMILTISLLALFIQSRDVPKHTNPRQAGIPLLVLAMFFLGMAIEPIIGSTVGWFESEITGVLLIIIPLVLIATIIQSATKTSPIPTILEEE